MYNPKKRVPATVEFTDIIAAGPQPARRRSSTSPATRTPTHSCTSFARFAIRSVAASVRLDRSRARCAGDGGRTDPRGPRRRRTAARAHREGSRRRADRRNSTKERDLVQRCKAALEDGTPLRALQLAGDDLKRLRGFQFLSAKPLLLVINLDEGDLADVGADIERAAATTGLTGVPRACRDQGGRALRQDRARDLAARGRRCEGVSRRSRAERIGTRSRHPHQLRPARLHVVLHGRRRRMPRLVDRARHAGAARGRRDPQRHPARLHPRRSRGLRRADRRGSMAACRDHGEVRLEGKEYVVQDGDIINFRFAT